MSEAKTLDLMTGLAGSLRLEDLPRLKGLHGVDYLGFRGALCAGGRTGQIQPDAVVRIRQALDDLSLQV